MLTVQQLRKIMPHCKNASEVVPILNATAKQYNINNERRMAAWLATLAVESGEFKYQEEIASGSAYEGRKDLGNTQKGDGRKFKGHGRIQITGRTNHTAYTNYLKKSKHLPFVDFTVEPRTLAQEPYATDSAGWFWAVYAKLNTAADHGDFLTTQVRVNGRNKKTGLPNHWKERNAYFIKGLSILPDNFKISESLDSTSTEPSQANDTADTAQTSTETPIVSSDVTLEAPAKDGATATSTKLVIAGITVPTFLVPIVTAIKELATEGYVDVKEIIAWMLSFIRENQKYVFMLIGLLIVLLIVKKIVKQVTFWISMITHALPGTHSVTVVVPEAEKKAWWKF